MPSFPYVMPQLLNLTPLAASGNSNPISLPPRSANMAVTIHWKFTLGSLTNAAVVVQALHVDGSTWVDCYTGAGGLVGSGTMAASTNGAISLLLPGVKQVRVRYTSTGVVTSSALVVDATVQQ